MGLETGQEGKRGARVHGIHAYDFPRIKINIVKEVELAGMDRT